MTADTPGRDDSQDPGAGPLAPHGSPAPRRADRTRDAAAGDHGADEGADRAFDEHASDDDVPDGYLSDGEVADAYVPGDHASHGGGRGGAHGAGQGGSVRVDSWIWSVRLIKSRSLAATACRGGHVRVNGERVKPAHGVRVGDEVRLRHAGRERIVVVKRLLRKRVGAPEAVLAYVDNSPPPPPREATAPAGVRDRGTGRPTKRDRREMERLRGGIAFGGEGVPSVPRGFKGPGPGPVPQEAEDAEGTESGPAGEDTASRGREARGREARGRDAAGRRDASGRSGSRRSRPER